MAPRANSVRRYYRIISPTDTDLSRVQNALGDAVDDISALVIPFVPLNGLMISVTLVAATTQNVQHKLGRAYSGMFPIYVSASPTGTTPAQPYVDATVELTIDKNQFIPVRSDKGCTATLWVW
jgi:hypothetical protein